MTQANLFDPPVRGHRPTRRPSEAVKNRKAGHDRAITEAQRLQRLILNTYRLMGPMTDAEMAAYCRLERTCVNGRRNELMKAGFVEEKGSKKNTATGVNNTLYGMKQG